MKPRVLIVDDEKMIHTSFLLALQNSGLEERMEVDFAFSSEQAFCLFNKRPFEYAVAFVDYIYKKSAEGHLLVKKLKELNPCLTTIIMSGDTSEAAVKNWMESKVDKFIFKPILNETIKAMIENSLQGHRKIFLSPRTNPQTVEQEKIGLIGVSENIRSVCKLALQFAKSNQPTLILGETGTGKGVVAKAMHGFSGRSGRFVQVSCIDQIGELPDGSSVFFNNIHRLNIQQQTSLLTAIRNNREIRFLVGGSSHLREMAEAKEFLPELYFCIAALNLSILPLRERPEDIIPTVMHFQQKIEKESGVAKQIMRSTLQKLSGHSWPGNVEELKGEIQRLNLMVERRIVRESDLSKHILEQKEFSYYSDGNLLTMKELEEKQKKQEVMLIIKALKQTGNNISKASKILNMNRTTLSSKMEQYGLKGKDTSILEIIFGKKGGRDEKSNQQIHYFSFAE